MLAIRARETESPRELRKARKVKDMHSNVYVYIHIYMCVLCVALLDVYMRVPIYCSPATYTVEVKHAYSTTVYLYKEKV